MTSLRGFTVNIDQNPYLPAGGRDVSAVVTVTADQAGDVPSDEPGHAVGSAEILIVDSSLSMGDPGDKIVRVRAATAAAVGVIRDGTWFAVVQGAWRAWPVYPPDGTMAVASEGTRKEARRAIRKRRVHRATHMSTWLQLAYQMFQSCPAALRHAILLTDGQNMESPELQDAAIALCEGTFRCDCRGVGTDWQVSELRKVSTALLGTVDIVADPAGLAADFQEVMRGAMSKQLPDVALRVWTPQQGTVRFVKQVAPAITDLTGRRVQCGEQAGDYPTGAWAPGESRDYHVGIQVNAASVGQQVLGQGLVRATWTEEEAHTARLLSKVVDVVDEATGTVRLKKKVEVADEMALDTRSTKTVQARKDC